MTERRRTSTLLALALSASLAVACASLGTPSIAEVHDNPGRYVDHTVTVDRRRHHVVGRAAGARIGCIG